MASIAPSLAPSAPRASPGDPRSVRARSRRARSALIPLRASPDASPAPDEAAAVARDTRRWLDDLVMGLNLCPFARPALPGTTVLVSAATTPDALRLELRRELETLRRAPADSARTTLLVIPPSHLDALDARAFPGFMDGARVVAEEEARAVTESATIEERVRAGLDPDAEEDPRDLIEIVPFHPRATFAAFDVDPEDEANSGGYICTYLDIGGDGEVGEGEDGGYDASAASGGPGFEEFEESSSGSNARGPPDEAALREMIAAHESMRRGADTRLDWAEANARPKNKSDGGEDSNPGPSDGATASYPGGTPSSSPAAPTDPADFTGRSPHPVLHLLRTVDVDAADEGWHARGPGTDIRAVNAAALRGLGAAGLAERLEACVTAEGGVLPARRARRKSGTS